MVYNNPGANITGVAYSWGGKESIQTFQDRINSGKIPRNWEGNTQPVSKYAGVDCSGLVENCWGIVMLQFKIKGEERISRINKNRKWRLA